MSDKIASWGEIYDKLKFAVDDYASFSSEFALYNDFSYCPTKHMVDGAGWGIYVDTDMNRYKSDQLVRLQDVKCTGTGDNSPYTISGRFLFQNNYGPTYDDYDFIQYIDAVIIYYNEAESRVEEMHVMASVYNPNGDFDVTFTLPQGSSSSLLEVYFKIYMLDGYPYYGSIFEGYYGFYDGVYDKDINIGLISLYEY